MQGRGRPHRQPLQTHYIVRRRTGLPTLDGQTGAVTGSFDLQRELRMHPPQYPLWLLIEWRTTRTRCGHFLMFFLALVAIVYPYEVLDYDDSGQEEMYSENLTGIRSGRIPIERIETVKFRQSDPDTVDRMIRRLVSSKNAASHALRGQGASLALSCLARKPQFQILGDFGPADVPLA